MDKTIFKVGFWSALIAFAAIVAFDIAQVLQLLGILSFPLDEILIYSFSLCLVLPLLLSMLALHYATPVRKKIWSHAALLFTVIYVIFVTANYVVQLTTVIPFTMSGHGEDIRVLAQTPHSMFWDYDAIGYVFMGLATLFACPVFKNQGYEKWVRYSFLLHALVTPLIAFVYFYPNFSDSLLMIGLPWAVTAPTFMLLLALLFRKRLNDIQQQQL